MAEPRGKRQRTSEKPKSKTPTLSDKDTNWMLDSKCDRYTMVTVEMNLPAQFGLGKGVMGGRFLLKHPLKQKDADTINALVAITNAFKKKRQITANNEDNKPWPIQRDIAGRIFGSFDAMSDRHYTGKDVIPLLVWQGYFTDDEHDEIKVLNRMADSKTTPNALLISDSYKFDLKYTE